MSLFYHNPDDEKGPVPFTCGRLSAIIIITMIRSTTVICVRHKGRTALAGDGQVSLGQTILKKTARKVRRLHKGDVLAGFAGATSDAFALFARFEKKLEEHRGNLSRAAIELAKDWRLDKSLRQLDALLIVADRDSGFLISGTGDVVEPDDGIVAIGSGGPYALAAARALIRHTELGARDIALEALRISAEICVYTNQDITVEEL
jgi:ATP-dependent HslUV protease, peptidase subunit HslV